MEGTPHFIAAAAQGNVLSQCSRPPSVLSRHMTRRKDCALSSSGNVALNSSSISHSLEDPGPGLRLHVFNSLVDRLLS